MNQSIQWNNFTPNEIPTRSAWQIMCAVQTALITRNIQKRFITNVNSTRSLSFLWIFLEPMVHIAVWMVIRGFNGLSVGSGSLPVPLFILLGAIPWLLTSKVLTSNTNSISSHKGLLMFRQIRPIDFAVASLLSELAVITVVFFIILELFSWYGITWEIHNSIRWMFVILSYLAFLLGASFIVMVLGFFFKFMSKVMTLIIRAMYLLSGVFFSINNVPVAFQKYLMINPLFQIVQETRMAFDAQMQHQIISDPVYLFKVGIYTLALGMGTYLMTRQKIMIEIQQR